jgi:peroxiredoxin Q/BCP
MSKKRRSRLGLFVLALFAFSWGAAPAFAALKVGQHAPDFTAAATLGGKPFTFALHDALKRGPVVIYFYPAAFTQGCTVEAHQFAGAVPDFTAAGASVIGVSGDTIATLNRFSVSECQSKFPVASDADHRVMASYDAKIPLLGFAKRTSYVVSQDGIVRFSYTDMDPDGHVSGTLAAVRALRK